MAKQRKRTTEVAGQPLAGDAGSDLSASTQAAGGPDVFDEAIAAQREAVPPAGEPNESTSPASHTSRFKEPDLGIRHKDVFAEASIAVTGDNDGPRAYLLRQNRPRPQENLRPSMWIQFDEKPDNDDLQKLREAGFRWRKEAFYEDGYGNERRGAWVKELDGEHAWRTHADAQRLFRDVANGIRARNGLEPSTVMGVMDR